MRELVLYIAMSPDGFIADSEGGVDWLHGHEDGSDGDGSYPELIKDIDTVLMGWNAYHQVTSELSPGEWPYAGLETWVFTHRDKAGGEGVIFTDDDPEDVVKRLKSQPGKGIWVCGGRA